MKPESASDITSPEARESFLSDHAAAVYAQLTDDFREPVRVEDLVYRAADQFPGLVPGRADMAEETRRAGLADKRGIEAEQGIFIAHVLGHPQSGRHLIRAMLRPKPEALVLLAAFRRTGKADLGSAWVERQDATGIVELRNPEFLNAEDNAVVAAMETAVDLVLLDPQIEVGVLRGATVRHPKHVGRRIFNSGLNLTALQAGQISLVEFMIARELGLLAKLQWGHCHESGPDEDIGVTDEKPWIAAVEGWAIGGGCQLLLVTDRVLAEQGAYFSLPASREGLVPGVAPARLARRFGGRLARQVVLFGRTLQADEPDGHLLCDEVVRPGGMDEAIASTSAMLTGSGLISAAANRKAIRFGEETPDEFRRYMAMFAREQARCLYSPALVRNLEQHWHARSNR
jgi:thioesterase DpgC